VGATERFQAVTTVARAPLGCKVKITFFEIPCTGPAHVHNDDEALACVLITQWTLLTGRALRADVPPETLSTDELINFWADEQIASDALFGDVNRPDRRVNDRSVPTQPLPEIIVTLSIAVMTVKENFHQIRRRHRSCGKP